MKVKIKHIDGITDVTAKVSFIGNEVKLDYRFEGMDYTINLDYEQAVKKGVIECYHPNVNPILGFENSIIGEICTVCNEEFKADKYQRSSKSFKTDSN